MSARKRHYETRFVGQKTVTAKCPQCERIYEVPELNWTGRGLPRIICTACKKYYSYKNNGFKRYEENNFLKEHPHD